MWQWAEGKKTDAFLTEKKQKKTKLCYNNDICRWKKDSFFQ